MGIKTFKSNEAVSILGDKFGVVVDGPFHTIEDDFDYSYYLVKLKDGNVIKAYDTSLISKEQYIKEKIEKHEEEVKKLMNLVDVENWPS